jgi:O-6-methylguanine DNA methyltransferase
VEVVRYEVEGWGVGELLLEGERLLYHEHPVPRPGLQAAPNHPQGIPEIPVVKVAGGGSRVCAKSVPELVQRLGAYFTGDLVGFGDVALDLDWCTPFQCSLAASLRDVPRGETVTYGELAALAGRPNAPRAAGSFCAHNRFAVIVPCHRVVSAGGLGSYGSLGLAYKRRLLELEGADVPL